jgi:hypothetical protein
MLTHPPALSEKHVTRDVTNVIILYFGPMFTTLSALRSACSITLDFAKTFLLAVTAVTSALIFR